MVRGLWFDERTWDGTDVFLLGQTATIMITDRIARLFRQQGIKGAEIVRQSEFTALEKAVV
jgi:hypothetical protein